MGTDEQQPSSTEAMRRTELWLLITGAVLLSGWLVMWFVLGGFRWWQILSVIGLGSFLIPTGQRLRRQQQAGRRRS